MNDRQRRLIDFFNNLPDPSAAEPDVEESISPTGSAAMRPRQTSSASVRQMLERMQGRTIAGNGRLLVGAEADASIEESILPVAPPISQAGLLRRPQPVQRIINERLVQLGISAAQKVENDEELEVDEAEVLEAIVLPGKRPVLDIIDGDFSTPPPDWEFLANHRARIQQWLPAVGRIDVPDLTFPPYAGTGFFVGPGLLMTNRHVAKLFVDGVGVGSQYVRFQPERSPVFSSQFEVNDPDPDSSAARYRIVAPLLVHPHWDVAILKVESVGQALPDPLRLARTIPPGFGGGALRQVIVLGYPMLDGRSDYEEQMNIFRKIFGRKRLMPGFLKGFADVETKWKATLHATTHDASTLGGNSGSAVIDLETGIVLALHFGGKYLVNNYGVPGWELAQDRHVVDLGLNFEDYPLTAGSAPAAPPTAPPVWLDVWPNVKKLMIEEAITTPAAQTAGDAPAASEAATIPLVPDGAARRLSQSALLPVAPDWFERVSDSELVEAMRRDPQMTRSLIRATLLPEEAADLIADLERGLAFGDAAGPEEGVFDFLTGGTRPDPSLPEIILLHGIMGGHLASYNGLGGRVWLSPLAFLAGGVAGRLLLDEDGGDTRADQILYPDGLLRFVYEKAARKWRMRGFVVHEFAYDWRKPIANAAERLHFFIESIRLERPGKKMALVGHSMGGLVATLYAARHPEWSERVTQAIFMGAPLRGSFAPVQGLLGSYPVFAKLALVDLRDDLQSFVSAARTLPGLIDMLPDPELFPDAAPLYQRITWPAGSAPAQVWLDQSRQLKGLLAKSPILETARLIVSTSHGTVGAVRVVGGQLQTAPQNRAGDGTVPARSAAAGLSGATVFRASSTHGDLPREDAVIDAVEQLLKDGSCVLELLSQQAIADLPLIEEAITESLEESTASDLSVRLRTGIFTQRDLDFLLRSDHATIPGPVGEVSGGV